MQNKFELYKKFAYVGATIVAIIFIYFIQKTVSRYEQESKVAKEQQEAVKSQIVPTEENKTPLTEAPAVPSGGAEVPTTATPEVKAEEKTEVKPAEVKPVETPKVEEKKVEEKKPETKPFVQAPTTPLVSSPIPPAATPPPAPKPAEVKPAEAPKVEEKKVEEKKPVAKSQQVIIEALDNVEIRYTKDGESERTVKLKPEQFLTIKAESKINLNVSDSGAVNIIHNGRDKGVPGNLGQPTKISYP